MKQIKVYLQYPWKFPDSSYYKYLVENPPKEIAYINVEKQKGAITNYKKFFFSNFLKKSIRKTLDFFNISFPNAHLSPKGNYDLIHCCHCLSKNENKPWVADIEGVWQFWIGKPNKNSIEKVRKILLNENCKKIMPWTQQTAKEIINVYPEIKEKVEVVYPAVPVQVTKKSRRKVKKLTLLYAARYFWIKGGLIGLEALKKLKKKYDIETIFVSDAPGEIRKKYPEINFLDLMPHERLLKYYKKADIFFYPSLVDTFGFALLEAMSFGLPIITVNTMWTKSRKEIIENRRQGFIIDLKKLPNYYQIGKYEQKIVEELINKTSELIEDKNLRKRMTKNCIKIIKEGKFSIRERNKKLKRIYMGL